KVRTLVEGLHCFASGEHAERLAVMEPVEARIVEVGGSPAQREVFHVTIVAAALRAGAPGRAQALLERRLAKRPKPGHYWTGLRASVPGGAPRPEAARP